MLNLLFSIDPSVDWVTGGLVLLLGVPFGALLSFLACVCCLSRPTLTGPTLSLGVIAIVLNLILLVWIAEWADWWALIPLISASASCLSLASKLCAPPGDS